MKAKTNEYYLEILLEKSRKKSNQPTELGNPGDPSPRAGGEKGRRTSKRVSSKLSPTCQQWPDLRTIKQFHHIIYLDDFSRHLQGSLVPIRSHWNKHHKFVGSHTRISNYPIYNYLLLTQAASQFSRSSVLFVLRRKLGGGMITSLGLSHNHNLLEPDIHTAERSCIF